MAYKIAVIGGDGTGPEVVAEGLKVLKAVAKKHNFEYYVDLGLICMAKSYLPPKFIFEFVKI